MTGIEGCIFVHAAGFIGGTFSVLIPLVLIQADLLAFPGDLGNKTKEGAMKMALKALEM